TGDMRLLLAALFCGVVVGAYSKSVADNDLRKLLKLLTERKNVDARQGSGADTPSTVPPSNPFPMPNMPVEPSTDDS
ncbi:hypothetical protein MAR_014505, partial [Mya arenaria]